MNTLNLKAGDVLYIARRQKPDERVEHGRQAQFIEETWDVVRVTAKSIVLQHWPTNKQKRISRSK